MKLLKSSFALMALALIVVACGPKGKTVETSEAKKAASGEGTVLTVNTNTSVVTWIGSKPVGKHNGTINISGGELSLNGEKIVAGKFSIDINSLSPKDLEEGSKMHNDLKGHLMSPDFFDAANFPEATFEITSVKAFNPNELEADKKEYETEFAPATLSEVMVENPTHMISGNLTMRGTSKNITFPVSVEIQNGKVSAKANFNIDRTEWGLKYGDEASAVDKAKDRFIYNTVNVGFALEATTTSL